MNINKFALCALFSAAIAAFGMAQFLEVDSFGTFSEKGGAPTWTVTQTENVVGQSNVGINGIPKLKTMSGNWKNAGGTLTYSTGGNDSFVAGIRDITTDLLGNSVSVSGRWNLKSGKGAFAKLSAYGTFAIDLISTQGSPTAQTSSGFSSTNLSGTFEPSPEPGSLVALGIGGIGLILRRRKSEQTILSRARKRR